MNKNDVALNSYLQELGCDPRARAPVRGRSAAKTPSRLQDPGSDRNRASRRRVKRHRKTISSLVKCSPPNSGDRGVTQQTMKANDADWDFSRWFVVLSPLIGVLLGFFGVFLVNH